MNAGDWNLELPTKSRLVYKQEVADQECVFHARGGNTEGLHDVGSKDDPDQQRRTDRSDPGDHLLLERLVGRWSSRSRLGHGRSTQSAMKMLVSPCTLPCRLDAHTRRLPSGANIGKASNSGLAVTCSSPVPSRSTR